MHLPWSRPPSSRSQSHSRSRSPSTVVHTPSTTESESEQERQYYQDVPWTDGFVGTDFARHRPELLMREVPNIHHGPRAAIHTTFQKYKKAEYKIVFSYNESPRRFKEVLSRLTTALVGQNVTRCKVFTNPTHREKLGFVYIPDISVTELLTIVNIIKREFQPAHLDLRENVLDASILMSFSEDCLQKPSDEDTFSDEEILSE